MKGTILGVKILCGSKKPNILCCFNCFNCNYGGDMSLTRHSLSELRHRRLYCSVFSCYTVQGISVPIVQLSSVNEICSVEAVFRSSVERNRF
jgi:hypothetical protein